jgi:hypothetical protein
MSAMPIGAPGCPELAFCTASMLKARMAFANSRREVILFSFIIFYKLRVVTSINRAILSRNVLYYTGHLTELERVETTRSFDITLN